MTDLKVQLNAQIPSGPTFQSNRTVAVENYETFSLSIPPNKASNASAGIDRKPMESEGPIKLLMIQSNIYPVGAGEIMLTLGTTQIANKPLHEPLLLLGTQVIASLSENEIAQISFVNTYTPTKPGEKETAEQQETSAKEALATAKTEVETAEQVVEAAEGAEATAGAEEALQAANAKVTEAEKSLQAAADALTKAIAAVEQEIADHTAQITILIGRDVSAT